MKIYFILPMLIVVGLSGCAADHYIKSQPDSVAFFLKMPKAISVSFASSVDNYALHTAEQISSGTWQITVPGRSELKYFYIIDGSVYLPDCRFKETDDFGSENCLYVP